MLSGTEIPAVRPRTRNFLKNALWRLFLLSHLPKVRNVWCAKLKCLPRCCGSIWHLQVRIFSLSFISYVLYEIQANWHFFIITLLQGEDGHWLSKVHHSYKAAHDFCNVDDCPGVLCIAPAVIYCHVPGSEGKWDCAPVGRINSVGDFFWYANTQVSQWTFYRLWNGEERRPAFQGKKSLGRTPRRWGFQACVSKRLQRVLGEFFESPGIWYSLAPDMRYFSCLFCWN